MIKSAFRRTLPLGDFIFNIVRRLGRQHARLELVANRLRERGETLFNSCESAIEKGHRESATIYANEAAEVRKLIRIVTQAQIVIERVILRLETVKEMYDIIKDLRSVLDVTQNAAKQLIEIMPEISFEMNQLSDVVTEMLVVTKLSSTPPITPIKAKDAGTEEILQETVTFVEEKLRERIPEPPAPLIAEAVSVRAEKMEQVKIHEKTEPQQVSLTVKCSSVTGDQVLRYAPKKRKSMS